MKKNVLLISLVVSFTFLNSLSLTACATDNRNPVNRAEMPVVPQSAQSDYSFRVKIYSLDDADYTEVARSIIKMYNQSSSDSSYNVLKVTSNQVFEINPSGQKLLSKKFQGKNFTLNNYEFNCNNSSSGLSMASDNLLAYTDDNQTENCRLSSSLPTPPTEDSDEVVDVSMTNKNKVQISVDNLTTKKYDLNLALNFSQSTSDKIHSITFRDSITNLSLRNTLVYLLPSNSIKLKGSGYSYNNQNYIIVVQPVKNI